MRYLEIKVMESLKPSEYRTLVKGWNKQRYAELFLNPKYKHDRKGYRVYIPIEKEFRPDTMQNSPIYVELEKFLSENGFHIVDYVKGIVQNLEKKQQIKIGKVLTKLNRQDLLNKFNTDKSREGTKSQYMVVISRHPYDIGGMSTDRGWRSCMNLHDGINAHYVPVDIKEGSVIAYVTTTNDVNLQNPSGRVLMKPFIDILGKPVVHFGIENQIYGTNVPGFIPAVTAWVNEINDKNELDDVVVLQVNKQLYRDSDLARQTFVRGKSITPDMQAQIKSVQDDPRSILNMENPSEVLQIAAMNDRMFIFRELMKRENYIPPESVQRLIITKDSDNINLLFDKGIKPSDEVQLAAVSGDWRIALTLINKNIRMSDLVVKRAVEQYPRILPDLVKAGYEINKGLMLTSLRSNNGDMLDWFIKNDLPVDLDIEVAAIENGYSYILNLFFRYKEAGKQFPEILIDKLVNGNNAWKILEILQHNDRSPVKDIMPLSEEQIVQAMVVDKKSSMGRSIFRDIIDEYPEAVSENGWFDLLKRTYPDSRSVRILITKQLITQKTVRALLPYNGDLIERVEDPTEQEILTAIKNKPSAISNIENPSVELQVFATKLDPNAIQFIALPSAEALRVAAMYKEKDKNWHDEYGGHGGHLEVYAFLTSLYESEEAGTVTPEDKSKLVKLLITTEPHRITSLIHYNSPKTFPVTEELQMIAVDQVRNMVRDLLDYDLVPAEKALIVHARKHGQVGNIIDKVARLNKRNGMNIALPDEFFLAYLDGTTEARDAMYLISNMAGTEIPVSKVVINRVLELSPNAVTTILANKFEISPEQIFDAVRKGGVNDRGEYTFLSAIDQKYNEVPEELLIELLKSGDANVRFLRITNWAEKQNKMEQLTDRFYKAALVADYGNIVLMKNPSQELKDFNYETNGYWYPIKVGDMVRVSNPKATPKYEVVRITPDSYVLKLDGEARSTFPKERIHKVNGIEKPKDYEEKQKLFVKKWLDR